MFRCKHYYTRNEINFLDVTRTAFSIVNEKRGGQQNKKDGEGLIFFYWMRFAFLGCWVITHNFAYPMPSSLWLCASKGNRNIISMRLAPSLSWRFFTYFHVWITNVSSQIKRRKKFNPFSPSRQDSLAFKARPSNQFIISSPIFFSFFLASPAARVRNVRKLCFQGSFCSAINF